MFCLLNGLMNLIFQMALSDIIEHNNDVTVLFYDRVYQERAVQEVHQVHLVLRYGLLIHNRLTKGNKIKILLF